MSEPVPWGSSSDDDQDPHTAQLLAAQRQAWQHGKRTLVETFLQQQPLLQDDTAIVLDLIYHEIMLREQRGEKPRLEEYLIRFPDRATQLRIQFEVDQAFGLGQEAAFTGIQKPEAPVAPPLLTSVPQLVEELTRSNLLEPARLHQVAHLLQKQFAEPQSLAHDLVQRGWLTPYQAKQILHGRGRQLVLGAYILLAPLGEGGMGKVFKARHQVMKRLVALKLIRKGYLPHGEAVKRFEQEIEVAASLSPHPNVVTAHDAGRAGDLHFFALEYVEGTDLALLVKQRGPLSVTKACDFVRQAALGLQHAHEHGLVHRDIKPSNLLLSSKGAVVKVLDMGLARLRYDPADKGSKGLTRMGEVMGTPEYISPEQAIDSSRVDIRADIYSLGCTLYHLLTGQPPFPKGSLTDKLIAHREKEPQPVEQLCPEVLPALAAIVRKMMAKRPEKRYQTPAETADALASLLSTLSPAPRSDERITPAGSLLSAKAETRRAGSLTRDTPQLPTRTVKWRWLAAGMAGGTLLLAVLAVYFLLWLNRPHNTGMADPPEELALQKLKERAERVRAGQEDLDLWLKDLCDFRRDYPNTSQDNEAGHLLEKLPEPLPRELVGVLGKHGGGQGAKVQCVTFSPDGRWIACGRWEDGIHVWDATALREQAFLRERVVDGLAFSRDGQTLAFATGHGVFLWDMKQEPRPLGKHVGRVRAVAFTLDGKTLASCGDDQTVIVWDAATLKDRHILKGHGKPVYAVAFTRDGKTLASAGYDMTVRVWDVTSGICPETFTESKGVIESVAFSPDGRMLACVGSEGFIWRRNIAEGKAKKVPLLGGRLYSVAFALERPLLAYGGSEGHVTVRDVALAKVLQGWQLPGAVWCIAFAPDGKHLATANANGTVYILRLPP